MRTFAVIAGALIFVCIGCSGQGDPANMTKEETPAPTNIKSLPDYKDPGHVLGRDPITPGTPATAPKAPKGGK